MTTVRIDETTHGSHEQITTAPNAHPLSGQLWRLVDALLYALPLLLALAIYGYSVSLPYFLDDGPHFQILEQTDGLRHWGDFPPFPFYRPVAFTLWKLLGTDNAALLHLVNVLCFGLAGVVLGQIVRRLSSVTLPKVAAILAGCAFVSFPFSYQAVAMVAALFHLMLTLGMVLCMWLALRWLDGDMGYGGLLLCWICAFIAVFSHENGVLLPVLLAGLLFVAYQPGWRTWPKLRYLGLVMVPISTITALYLLLWFSFRPQESTGLTTDFITAFAAQLQGLIYPVIALVRPLVTGDADPLLILALVAIVILPLLVLMWRQLSEMRLAAIYAVGWYVLAVLPATMVLPAGYVLGQPRLALLASVGSSILWGGFLAWVLRRGYGIPFLIMAGLSFYISLEFLGMRRADFITLRNFNAAAVATFEESRTYDAETLLVNVPDFITPLEANRRFLLGTEGVLFVDETLDYSQQFSLNSDYTYDQLEVIAYPQIQRNEGFDFRAHPPVLDTAQVAEQVQNAEQVYVMHFAQRNFWLEIVGGTQFADDHDRTRPYVSYPETGFSLWESLGNYDEEGKIITVATTWQVSEPAPIKTFVHVYCDGEFIAQSDGYPWGDTYPFVFWQPGEMQTDIRTIYLDGQNSTITQECLQLFTGLYQEADVTRLQAVDASTGERFTDDLFPVLLLPTTAQDP